jgi:hypothetical protein
VNIGVLRFEALPVIFFSAIVHVTEYLLLSVCYTLRRDF